jgi:hypothetical protein
MEAWLDEGRVHRSGADWTRPPHCGKCRRRVGRSYVPASDGRRYHPDCAPNDFNVVPRFPRGLTEISDSGWMPPSFVKKQVAQKPKRPDLFSTGPPRLRGALSENSPPTDGPGGNFHCVRLLLEGEVKSGAVPFCASAPTLGRAFMPSSGVTSTHLQTDNPQAVHR